jgi:hypothetical protein
MKTMQDHISERDMPTLIEQMIELSKMNVAASLAAALIIASRRPHSYEESMLVLRNFQFSLFPQEGEDGYEKWKASFNTKKGHV